MPERMYTVEETRRLLGSISMTKLWRMRKSGEIEFRRIGCRPFFYESYIDEFQQRNKEGGGGRRPGAQAPLLPGGRRRLSGA